MLEWSKLQSELTPYLKHFLHVMTSPHSLAIKATIFIKNSTLIGQKHCSVWNRASGTNLFASLAVIIDTPCKVTLIERFMGPTWGPPGANRTQVGPMLAPWTLQYGYAFIVSWVPLFNHNGAQIKLFGWTKVKIKLKLFVTIQVVSRWFVF